MTVEKAALCPICKGDTKEVKGITVKHLVVDTVGSKANEEVYHICLSEDCDVTYFNLAKDILFRKQDVKIPLWFKKGAYPKYICYCNGVTEQQIIDAVLNNGAKDMKDIIRLTGAMKNGKCEINNPLGVCCGPFIQEVINRALDTNP